ncbi:succinate dehydrogenase, hydrophobic membrane anchor protein [uncultured Shewanella sp.]|uniref:succinate dehydrogenase, hydrophobic membrane anchor protein n=1 Tax=uncultured Shewanella sp. TaxID=173975 RepID=UPI00261F20D9|nr:succinate dehydrogenase, hydrophobic membrane anchor protein [uncultured Shewanella sp.]
MVTNAASLGRSGVHDFILIRASAIILACYTIFMVGFVACNSPLTYDVWHGLFSVIPMKVFTILTLIAVLVHAWIGIWQVLTDYVKNVAVRGVLQFVFVIAAFSYLVAGILIVWGV